jgi:DNA-binding response OmpR family regulator
VIDTNSDVSVLVVEDDRDVRELIRQVLVRKRFRVLVADGVWQAVEKFAAADILTLDLNLPNGDGRNVLRQWIKLSGLKPSIVVSAYLASGEEDSLLASAWNVLRKPFDIDLLADIVERYAFVVRGDRCCREIAKLKRMVFMQWLVIAGGLGTQYVMPLLKAWIGGL